MADKILIEGLIKFCDEKSKNIKLKAEPQVFIEIKQALEELKAFKSDDFTENLLNMGYTKGIRDGYNKAIDKFAERMKEKEEGLYVSDGGGFYNDSRERAYNDGISAMDDAIDEVVEQMKAGVNNGYV